MKGLFFGRKRKKEVEGNKATLKHKDVITVGKHNLIIYYKEEAKKPAQDFADKTVKIKT